MDFEEMQIVWDEQKKQRVYALDLDALHASVRRRGRRIARGIEMMEIGLIVLSIVMVGFSVILSIVNDRRSPQIFTAVVLAAVATYLIVGRLQRRARERTFDANLLGDLGLAISQLDYHIRRIRTFPLWFCAPLFVTVLIGLVSKHGSKEPSWAWLLVFAAFPLSIYVARLELRCLVPRKRELEALRAKLSSES